MRVALVGYGKMGKAIEALAPEAGAEIALVLDEHNNRDGNAITRGAFADVDVAIEFTAPAIAPGNLLRLAEAGVPTVTGTTGWYAALDEVRAAFAGRQGSLVWSPNFSIGVNLFDRLAAEAARLFAAHPAYGCWAWEMHHNQKLDAPSGTLKALVETMRDAGYSHAIDISSTRAGKAPGTHEIGFDSQVDTIELRHTARSRDGFAGGALYAAKLLLRQPGIYRFADLLFPSTSPKESA
ncbi:MAG: dihydrodipicolinate reductase [Bryobacterales bacterium]|jgi:4-hydroxy-tetrahydrodipicolinate reductase|nr:dihydrodipicolinate reductase [Bryobacterales bacterium]